jgi:hypothetical protein
MSDPKPRKQYFLGSVALVFGFLFGALGTWGAYRIAFDFALAAPFDIWRVAAHVWFFGMAIYLIFVGHRKLSTASSSPRSTMSRIGWGRVLTGTFVAYITLMTHFNPPHNRYELKPSNETQAKAMKGTEAILTVSVPIAGIILAAWGLRSGFKPPANAEPNVDRAPQRAAS